MSSSNVIPVLVGAPIPLNVQEVDRDGTKIVRAFLFDLSDFSSIAGPITLTHEGDGTYRDVSENMPDVSRVYARYFIFDADGTTPNTDGEKAVADIFTRDTLVQDIGDVVGSASRDPDFVASIEDQELSAIIENDIILQATIENDTELVATIESSELEATIDADSELDATLE